MPQFNLKSLDNLNECHSDLIKLFMRVIVGYDCSVIEGFRNAERQNMLYAKGYSQVHFPNSYHNRYPSRACDVCPYPIDWNNIERFKEFGGYVKKIAKQLYIYVEWGGDWKKFKDYAP